MSERQNSEKEFADKVCNFPADSMSDELQVLTKDPAYICGDCGRSAAKQENLCKPERMFSSW